jgi:hypothetical protein
VSASPMALTPGRREALDHHPRGGVRPAPYARVRAKVTGGRFGTP